MNPIQSLMQEHRLIEKVLHALEVFAERAARGGAAPREDLGRFTSFLTTFADECHHGKEEGILFTAMAEAGMPANAGPIAVMLHEHEVGRRYIEKLGALASGTGPISEREAGELSQAAGGYAAFLRSHIGKEDHILYPMAENLLPAEEMARMAGRFEDFERDRMGDKTHQCFHHDAEALIAAYAS